MAEGEAPERGGGEAGEGSGTDRQGAASKVDEWRRYFRDRGLSAGDIPKALVVHEVRASRGIARGAAAQTGRGAGERGWSSGRCLGAPVPRAQHAPRVPPPCGVLRRGAAEAPERARRPRCEQVIGLAWFASSWAVCYSVQPCRALGSRFFATRSEQFFAAAQRYAAARQQRAWVAGGGGCARSVPPPLPPAPCRRPWVRLRTRLSATLLPSRGGALRCGGHLSVRARPPRACTLAGG